MNAFPVHTADTAPADAKTALKQVNEAFGFIPNVMGVMAASPALLKGYLSLTSLFDQTSFSPTERQVVILSISHENGCHYCMAAHTVVAEMSGVPSEVVEALRNDTLIADTKLEALRRFTRALVRSRGWPTAAEAQAFLDAGYSETNILEVVLGVGMKTLSNYTNHLAQTDLDEAFAPKAWQAVG